MERTSRLLCDIRISDSSATSWVEDVVEPVTSSMSLAEDEILSEQEDYVDLNVNLPSECWRDR